MKLASAVVVLSLSATAAQAIPATEFAARWKAISGRDRSEVVRSPDLPVLIQTFTEAGKAYRADIEAARAADRRPRACPPEKIEFSVDDFIAALPSLPPAQRAEDVEAVMGRILDARYPCPAVV